MGSRSSQREGEWLGTQVAEQEKQKQQPECCDQKIRTMYSPEKAGKGRVYIFSQRFQQEGSFVDVLICCCGGFVISRAISVKLVLF